MFFVGKRIDDGEERRELENIVDDVVVRNVYANDNTY